MPTGIKIRITADDQASHVIDGVNKKVKGMTGGIVGGSRMMKSGFGRIGAAAGKMGTIVRMASIAGGVALAGMAAGIITVGAKFEQSIANITSIVPEGVAAFNELAATARHWGSTTAFSASEAAEGMYALASSGLAVADIRDAIGGTLMFAGAAATDLGSATETVVGALKQFGMEADQTNRVVNVFAAGIASSMLNAERLKEALSAVGATANAAGLSLEKTVGILGLLHNAGMMGSVAGTNLKNVLVRLLTPNKAMNSLLGETVFTGENLGEVFDAMRGKMDDVGTVFKAFGRIAAPAALVMIRAGGDAMDEMARKVTGTRKAFEMYQIQMNTVASKGKILKSQLQEIFIATFEQIKPAVTGAMDAILNGMIRAKPYIVGVAMAITKFVQEKGALISKVLKFVAVAIAMIAVIKIGIVIFGILSTAVSVIIGAVQILIGIVTIFGSIFGTILVGLFSPIGLLVAAIVGIGVLAYKAFSSVWDSSKSLTTNLAAGFGKMWEYIVSGFDWLADRITTPIYYALLWVADKLLWFADKVGFIVDQVFPGFSAAVGTMRETVTAELDAAAAIVQEKWGQTADDVGGAFGSMAGRAKGGFDKIRNYVNETIARMKVMGDKASGGIDMGGMTFGDVDKTIYDAMSDDDKKLLAQQLESIQTKIDAEDAAWMKIVASAGQHTTRWLNARKNMIMVEYETELAAANDNAVKIAEAEIARDTALTEAKIANHDAYMERYMENHQMQLAALDSFGAAYDTFFATITDSEMTMKRRRELMWSDMKRSFLRSMAGMLKSYLKMQLKNLALSLTAEKAHGMQVRYLQAKLGALKAYQAFAAIPIIGPVLGAIAAAAAFAFLMAFHSGGLIPGNDNDRIIKAQGGEYVVQRSGINAETMPVIQHINATGHVPETRRAAGNEFVFNIRGGDDSADIRDAIRQRVVPILEEMAGTGELVFE